MVWILMCFIHSLIPLYLADCHIEKIKCDDVQILKTVIQHEHWRSVTIVYEHDNNCTRFLKTGLSEIGVLASFFDINHFLERERTDFSGFVSFTKPVPVILLCSDKSCEERILWNECCRRKRTPLQPQIYWLLMWTEFTNITELSSLTSSCVTRMAVVTPIVLQDDLQDSNLTFVYSLQRTRGDGGGLRLAATVDDVGNMIQLQEIFPNKHGFQKEHFIAATLQVKPFLYKEGGQYIGFLADILDLISSSLNFTYEFVEAPDGKYGSVENASWNGLVGMMVRKEADMIMADISTTYSRSHVVDFTQSYNYDVAAVVIKQPSNQDNGYASYIELFQWEVHVCIVASIILGYLFIKAIEAVNPFYKDRRTHDRTDDFTSFWDLYGSLLKQGRRDVPTASHARRVFLGTWWIFAIILSSVYSGNLIAFLTVSRLRLPFDTISEMVQQDQFTWGTYGGSNYISFFKGSQRSEYRKVADGFRMFSASDPSSLSTKAEVHRRKVLNGNYGFIGGKPTLEFWVSQNCQLKLLSEGFFSLLYGIGLPKNSPYTTLFSDQIITMHETGIMAKIKSKWWPRNGCSELKLKYAKPIQLSDIQSAFYVLAIGVGITILVLTLEIIYNKFKIKHKCRST